MKKILTLLFFPIFLLGLSACGNEITNQINEAAEAVENSDNELAQSICDRIVDEHWDDLTLENKCDLAVLYVSFLELDLTGGESSNEHNLEMLKQCYTSAKEEDPDATREYLNSMQDGFTGAIEVFIGGDWLNEFEESGIDIEGLQDVHPDELGY